MAKREIVFSDLKNFLLSPGNIFWKKMSGEERLISAKGDFCNIYLIEKLTNSKQELFIDDEVDRNMMNEAAMLIEGFKSQLLIKEKNIWKKRMLEFLNKNFIVEKKTQFELTLIFWSWFSSYEKEKAEKFISIDRDFFIRSIDLATTNTFISLCLGYYDQSYLENIFTSTMIYFEDILESGNVISLKEQLANLKNDDMKVDDRSGWKDLILNCPMPLFEHPNGTGPRQLVANELNEWEKVIGEINLKFSYNEMLSENILSQLVNNNFDIDKNIIEIITNELIGKKEEAAA